MKVLILLFLIVNFMSCNPLDKRSPEVKRLEEHMESLDDDTLLGPDKNNDGVRDDVEYWINNSKEIENNDIRRAALLYAKYLRNGLKYYNDKEKSIANTYQGLAYKDCFSLLFEPFSKKRTEIREYILNQILNSKERTVAHLKADRNFAGKGGAMHMYANEACPFKLEKRYQRRGERYVPKK